MKNTILLCVTSFALIASAGASHAILNSHFENFTTTTHRGFSTTADWNTTDGELRLQPFSPSLVGSFAFTENALDVVVDGNYAYVANTNDGLQILDISNPASPLLAGSHFTPGSVTDICIAGNLAFLVIGNDGVRVLDITNPASPLLLDVYNPAVVITDVFVAGDIAYMATLSTFDMVDISDPTTLTLIGTYNHPSFGFGAVVEGNYAYQANSAQGLEVIDVSNPALPFLAGSAGASGSVSGVAVEGNYAYLCASSFGFDVFDISDPTNPVLATSVPLVGGARRAFVDGDVIYIAGLADGLHVYDITDPTNPVLRFTHDTPGSANGVFVDGEHAFVADQGSGIQVVEVRTRPTPTLTGRYDRDSPSGLAVSGNTVIFIGERSGDDGDAAFAIDISDPTNPVVIDAFNAPCCSMLDVQIDGDYAFIANVSAGVRILDISDPTNMIHLSTFDTDGARRTAVYGDYLFVADGSSGLIIADITDPSAPVLLGSYDTPGFALDVQVAGDLAYVADGASGIQIIDFSDPTAPALEGAVATASDAIGIAVAKDYAYVADQVAKFTVVDISSPASPAVVSSQSLAAWTNDIAVSGNYAFLSTAGLKIYDISNPSAPISVDTYSDNGFLNAVVIDGDYAFISEFDGLQIIRVFQGEWDTSGNIGQSGSVDGAPDLIVRARLTATETAGVSWEVAGGIFDPIVPDFSWHAITAPTTNLSWRATLDWIGTSPIVSDVQVEWLNEFAKVESVDDIPNDQGRQVRVTWTRSGYDFVGDPQQIVEYSVFRKIDPNLTAPAQSSGAAAVDESDLLDPSRIAPTGWDFIITVPADAEDDYAVVVPTLADSTISAGQYQTAFMVRARTTTPGLYYDSHPDSGYSTDNLAPNVPANLVIAHNTGSGNTLSWGDPVDADFQHFRVYRSSDPNFLPSENELVHSTTSTGWVDPDHDGGAVYYKVTATDFSGNESDAAESGTVTSIPSQRPADAWALDANVPNPFNPTTQIRYTVPAGAGDVSLQIYDVRGRLVRTLANRAGVPGVQTVTWDGRDQRGHSVASGVYFYRLTAPGFSQTRKMVLAK